MKGKEEELRHNSSCGINSNGAIYNVVNRVRGLIENEFNFLHHDFYSWKGTGID